MFVLSVSAFRRASLTPRRSQPVTEAVFGARGRELSAKRGLALSMFNADVNPDGGPDSRREAAMSIDELKSELDLRAVDYSDCLSKQELVSRLIESRALGKANPDQVFEKFNDLQESAEVGNAMDDSELLEDSVAGDGSLPGGLSPEVMRALAKNPAIVSYLRDPKMQEIMKAVMGGGPQAMKKYLTDPDALKMLQALSVAIQSASQPWQSPSGAGGEGVDNRKTVIRSDDPDVLQ